MFKIINLNYIKIKQEFYFFKIYTFPVQDVRKSSLRVIYDRNKLALIPRGGSTVILLPFCKIITGN